MKKYQKGLFLALGILGMVSITAPVIIACNNNDKKEGKKGHKKNTQKPTLATNFLEINKSDLERYSKYGKNAQIIAKYIDYLLSDITNNDIEEWLNQPHIQYIANDYQKFQDYIMDKEHLRDLILKSHIFKFDRAQIELKKMKVNEKEVSELYSEFLEDLPKKEWVLAVFLSDSELVDVLMSIKISKLTLTGDNAFGYREYINDNLDKIYDFVLSQLKLINNNEWEAFFKWYFHNAKPKTKEQVFGKLLDSSYSSFGISFTKQDYLELLKNYLKVDTCPDCSFGKNSDESIKEIIRVHLTKLFRAIIVRNVIDKFQLKKNSH